MNALSSFMQKYIQYFLLAGIVYVAIVLRWVSADFGVLYDNDPWWFYRHAQEIYDNNFLPPRWDILSHYPPGRPVDYYLGWSYTLAIAYKISAPFLHGLSLMKFSGLFVAVFASLSAIPAYFAGRIVTNRWGALLISLFIAISPYFLAVSLAGYPDSDAAVVFYTLLAVLTTLYAVKKSKQLYFENFKGFLQSLIRYIPYLIPALLAYWFFSINWNFSWYIYFIFLFFIPVLILVRWLEGKARHERGYFVLLHQKIRENRSLIVPIVLIGLFGQLISVFTYGWPYSTIPPHQQLIGGLNFLQAGPQWLTLLTILFVSLGVIVGLSVSRLKGLLIGASLGFIIPILLGFIPVSPILVGTPGQDLIANIATESVDITTLNVAVSELEPTDLFSLQGLVVTAERVGGAPIILGVVGIFGIIIFKLFTKREVTAIEYFALFWIIISLVLASTGIRFFLLLTVPVAISAGLVLGNLIDFLQSKKGKRSFETSLILTGLIVFGITLQIYVDFSIVHQSSETWELSNDLVEGLTWLKENADRDSLTVTSWGLGHIITGFTGLKVHSDGAHCNAPSCIPYGLNTRVVDMGKLFSTTDESKVVDLLRKYTNFSPQDCRKVRESFGSILPSDACKTVSEVFVIVTMNQIDQYYMISYFGSFDHESRSGKGISFTKLKFTGEDANGNLLYENGKITIERKDDQLIPMLETHVIAYPSKELQTTKIKISQIIYFEDQGNEKRLDFSDSTDRVKSALVWVSPDRKNVVFIDEETKDRLFTKLFFLSGNGLEHFQLVFYSPEVKIYKVLT